VSNNSRDGTDVSDPTLAAALDAADDLVFAVAGDGSLVAWNDGVGRVTGHPDDVLATTSLADLFAAPTGSIETAVTTARETGHATLAATLVAADDRPRYALRFDRLTDDADDGDEGEAGGTDGTNETDVTDRTDEADRTDETDEGDGTGGAGQDAALVCVARRMADDAGSDGAADPDERERTLREMHAIVADRDRTFTGRVEGLLDLGREVLGTRYGTLSSVDGDDYHFEVVRAPDGTVEAGDTVPLSTTNCERAVVTERTLVLADVARDAPDLAERAGFTDWGIACYLGAPVYVDDGDEVYGTFCFYDETPRVEPFSEWEVTLVDLMSRWVSVELERRRTTEDLRRSNEQLEQFATVVSHDLRNPLSVVSGSLELAERTGDAEHFERCRRALGRMERMIDDLLSLARSGRRIADPEPVSLASLARRAWDETGTDGSTLDVAVTEDVRVVADGSRLQQLLANLLRNSVEHGSTDESADEGGVTVRVGLLADREGFFVADDGPGIPPEERDRVFETGYSTTETGTGIGLATVEQVATAHGWAVAPCASESGGARFEVRGVEFVESEVDEDEDEDEDEDRDGDGNGDGERDGGSGSLAGT
jgi:GAF domain-containing protein